MRARGLPGARRHHLVEPASWARPALNCGCFPGPGVLGARPHAEDSRRCRGLPCAFSAPRPS